MGNEKVIGPSSEEAARLNQLRGSIPDSLFKRWLFVVAGAGIPVSAVLAAACASPQAEERIVETPTPELPSQVFVPIVTKGETPTPTPTPEVKKEVPCSILPQEYCSLGRVVEWNGNYFIAFRLPPNVPISSLFTGPLSTTGASGINPKAPMVSVAESPTGGLFGKERNFMVIGALRINDPRRGLTEPRAARQGMVKEEEIIAVTSDDDIRVFTDYGDYNVGVALTRFDEGTNSRVIDTELFTGIFPYYDK